MNEIAYYFLSGAIIKLITVPNCGNMTPEQS